MSSRFFSTTESELLADIIANRRDVRGNRFVSAPVSEEIIDKLLMAALHSPSVGFSQPWEFVVVRDETIRSRISESFHEENMKALEQFQGEKAAQYQRMRLEGIKDTPVNIAVFYKPSTGPVLGQTTMDEMGRYSVVCAIQNLWLMARALNVGVGWVSIVDPEKVRKTLEMPKNRQLIAYLCVGHVEEFLSQPELEQVKWEKRKLRQEVVFDDKYVAPKHD
ncbi:5,6-dimethylbenzimidazole synthase [Gammaproteobacteria bacterium 45_16_T64]|nr:5,6-dimethylbenzimidazole synthase [Gammaproteobacteria bacterium 45_16_T64]